MNGSAQQRILPGLPYPLGATWDGKGVNFALFSAHAEKVKLCLFDPAGRRELERLTLPEYTDQVWHGYLPEAAPGTERIKAASPLRLKAVLRVMCSSNSRRVFRTASSERPG